MQENPARANGHIFNVGNPHNEVTVRQLAEMMTEVNDFLPFSLIFTLFFRILEVVCYIVIRYSS